MKKVLFIIVVLVIACGLTSCGVSQSIMDQEKQVLEIAQSIPLPPTFYSSVTGNQLVAQLIKVKFTDTYATETGEPIFSVSIIYIDPHPCWWLYRTFHPFYRYWVDYDLMYSVASESEQYVGMVWAFNSDGVRSDFMGQFTVQGLQTHKSELEWR